MSLVEGNSWLRAPLAGSVILHLVILLWHGSAHTHIPVPLTQLQTIFIGFVIFLLPLIGAGMLWTRYLRTAAWLITLSMFGSLLFGFINHFVLISPDYVMEVPEHAWHSSFIISAALLAVTETIGTVIGAVALYAWSKIA